MQWQMTNDSSVLIFYCIVSFPWKTSEAATECVGLLLDVCSTFSSYTRQSFSIAEKSIRYFFSCRLAVHALIFIVRKRLQWG